LINILRQPFLLRQTKEAAQSEKFSKVLKETASTADIDRRNSEILGL